MKLYWRLPIILQETALSLYARYLEKIYYGPGYEKWKEWAEGSKNWSVADIEKWKNERLQYIIETAVRRVEHYRENFRGRMWDKVRSEKDLYLLPVLDKQTIRQNEGKFVVDSVNPTSLWIQKTSGTTGTSLSIYWPKSMAAQYWAIVEVFVRNVAGVSQEMPRAMIGGRPIVPGDTTDSPFWRFNRRWKQLYFSSYHISRKTTGDYVQALRKYQSQWVTGYGSAISALAENALALGIDPCAVKAVIVSGDTLLPGMRVSIEKFFKCKAYDHYGQSEGVAMAMECAYGKIHLIPFVGIIEILRNDGTPCPPGETGEIVATGLINDVMPLIRYRIGDFAAWAEDQCCPCGNPNAIITNLEGRTDDYLVTSDERKIGRLSTAMKRSPTIHSAQIVQDKPGHAYLLIRPGEGYRPSHGMAVRDDIMERIGKFCLEIVEVSEIPKTPQGKMLLVVRLDDRPFMREIYERLLGISVL